MRDTRNKERGVTKVNDARGPLYAELPGKPDKHRGTLVLRSLLFVVAVVLGPVLAIAISMRELKLDVVANFAVAVGTIGLAYFTWESVRGTQDIIAGEDRRHQADHAPLVYLQKTYGAARSQNHAIQLYAVLKNLGYGFAQNLTLKINGYWDVDRVSNGDGTYTMGDATLPKTHDYFYSVIAAPPHELATLDGVIADLPPGASVYHVQSYTVVYYDMFGNTYTTYSSDNYEKDGSFVWQPPKHLIRQNGNLQSESLTSLATRAASAVQDTKNAGGAVAPNA